MSILDECCGGENNRSALRTPFVREGWEGATNGCIIVRRPSMLPNTERAPSMSQLRWDKNDYCDDPIVLPEVAEFADECPKCCGGMTTCPTCGQDVSCGKCEGTGFANRPVDLGGGVFLRERLVRILRKYDALVYLRKTSPASCPLRFVVKPNFTGLVMPTKDEG